MSNQGNNIRQLLHGVIKTMEERLSARKPLLHEIESIPAHSNLLVVSSQMTGRSHQFIGLDVGIRQAVDEKIPILLIYSSGSGEQVVERILCKEACIDPWQFREGVLSSKDLISITRVCSRLAEAPISIVKLHNPASSDPATLIRTWQSHDYHL